MRLFKMLAVPVLIGAGLTATPTPSPSPTAPAPVARPSARRAMSAARTPATVRADRRGPTFPTPATTTGRTATTPGDGRSTSISTRTSAGRAVRVDRMSDCPEAVAGPAPAVAAVVADDERTEPDRGECRAAETHFVPPGTGGGVRRARRVRFRRNGIRGAAASASAAAQLHRRGSGRGDRRCHRGDIGLSVHPPSGERFLHRSEGKDTGGASGRARHLPGRQSASPR